jgi:hypothetical protein
MKLSRNRVLIACGLIALAGAAAACSDTSMALTAAETSDRPASIKCTGYNGVLFDGRSTGRIEYNAAGRLSFVDATTGGVVITEGECIVRYDR